jgi:outer membrane protein assembly factor BamD
MVALSLALSGCYGKKLQEEKSATELVAEGLAKFENRDYRSAITAFQRVKNWYPFSDQVPTAEMKIAEAYYKLRQYEQAAASYQDFANLHPQNPQTPYAMYQVGRCYFDQVDTIDRDQGYAQQALTAFNRFLAQYPGDEYAAAAKSHVVDCQRLIASNELLVAKYYFERKNYKAALYRFQNIVNDYPDTGVQHIALQYLAKCKEHVHVKKDAPEESP